MEVQTSDEAYEVYRKLKDREERVSKQNRGLTLLNADKFKPNFFISVLKKIDLNLLEKEEEVVVDSNVLSYDYYSYEGMSIKDFLRKFKGYMSIPVYDFRTQFNRRRENKVDFYYKCKFRKKDFEFEDVKITIGEQAKDYVDSLDFNFIEEVKKIIKNKKKVTEREIKDFERFSFLYNRVEDLGRQVKQSHYSNYSYGHDTDRTLKISITAEEYNQKLKEVEEELKILCKKYSYLELPRFDYIKIVEPITFEDWIKEHKSEVEDSWSEFDDEQKEDWDGDFDSYAESCFENFDEDEGYDEED